MLAYVTKAHEERRAVLMGGAFVAGMIVTHAMLGVTAALGGEWVQHVMGREWGLFLGPLLIVLGLIWPGWIKLRLLSQHQKALEILAGVTLILTGLYLLNEYLFIIKY